MTYSTFHQDYDERINEAMEELHNAVHIEDDSGSSTDQEDSIATGTCDKETNTVSMYSDRPTIKRRPQEGARNSTIRRSQTFSPACRPGSQYVCRVGTASGQGLFEAKCISRPSMWDIFCGAIHVAFGPDIQYNFDFSGIFPFLSK